MLYVKTFINCEKQCWINMCCFWLNTSHKISRAITHCISSTFFHIVLLIIIFFLFCLFLYVRNRGSKQVRWFSWGHIVSDSNILLTTPHCFSRRLYAPATPIYSFKSNTLYFIWFGGVFLTSKWICTPDINLFHNFQIS